MSGVAVRGRASSSGSSSSEPENDGAARGGGATAVASPLAAAPEALPPHAAARANGSVRRLVAAFVALNAVAVVALVGFMHWASDVQDEHNRRFIPVGGACPCEGGWDRSHVGQGRGCSSCWVSMCCGCERVRACMHTAPV
jgi:hypothetical protein